MGVLRVDDYAQERSRLLEKIDQMKSVFIFLWMTFATYENHTLLLFSRMMVTKYFIHPKTK